MGWYNSVCSDYTSVETAQSQAVIHIKVMAVTRILSISGLRGVIGDGLDPLYVGEFAAALGTMFSGGKVVVARDGRSTGPAVYHAVVAGLLATGCEVLDADATGGAKSVDG